MFCDTITFELSREESSLRKNLSAITCDFKTYTKKFLDTHKRCFDLRERTYRCDVNKSYGKGFFEKKSYYYIK